MMMRVETPYENASPIATRSIAQFAERTDASTAMKPVDSVQLIKLGSVLNAFETDSRRNVGRCNELHEMFFSKRYQVDSKALGKKLVQDMLNER